MSIKTAKISGLDDIKKRYSDHWRTDVKPTSALAENLAFVCTTEPPKYGHRYHSGTCRICGQQGHKVWDCPNKNNQAYRAPNQGHERGGRGGRNPNQGRSGFGRRRQKTVEVAGGEVAVKEDVTATCATTVVEVDITPKTAPCLIIVTRQTKLLNLCSSVVWSNKRQKFCTIA